MEKQPVGQLPDLTQSNNDDEIMVITNSEYNQLKKEKISDFITDLTSTDENNAIVKGTDGKLFTKDFGNASNITEGTLPVSVLPNIPKELLPEIETTDLPVSGVTADTYAYPSSVTVNAQGQVTAIEEGSPSGANANTDLSNLTETGESHFANPNLSNLTDEGEKHFLNKTQITNCILEAPNGVPAYSGNTVTVYELTQFLFPNGRNTNNTLKNVNFSLASNATETITGSVASTYYVFVTSDLDIEFIPQENYFEQTTQPTALIQTTLNGVWYNPTTNVLSLASATASTPSWSAIQGALCATLTYDGSSITSFNAIYPLKLLTYDDYSTLNSRPYITETYVNGASWYRLWSDGWCEQGGTIPNMPRGNQIYNLLKPYKDQNYILLADRNTMNYYQGMSNFLCGKPSGSQIVLNHGSNTVETVNWLAKGYVV